MNGQQEARGAPALGGYRSEAPPTVSEVPILAPSASPFHSHHCTPNAPEGQEILGVRLLKLLASPFASLTRSSQTLLRLDFRRPLSFPKRPSRPSPPPPGSSSPFGPLHGSRTRLQLMQTWDLPPKCEEEATEGGPREIPWLKLGIGGSVEMDDDGGVLVPKARLKTKYAILHVMPSPCFEIRMKFPVGISSLAASIRCRIPFSDLETMWNSPSSQLMVNFYNETGSGFHLTPGGLEFDEHLLRIGKYTTVRVAASLNFPRRLPPEEDEQLFKIDIRSIGLKTRLL
ncbi:uncharacterized protein LOC116255162 [Nymphaea colorata]|nr:uncharacterized protein LOC116255162 [Nymphaea colorata]